MAKNGNRSTSRNWIWEQHRSRPKPRKKAAGVGDAAAEKVVNQPRLVVKPAASRLPQLLRVVNRLAVNARPAVAPVVLAADAVKAVVAPVAVPPAVISPSPKSLS